MKTHLNAKKSVLNLFLKTDRDLSSIKALSKGCSKRKILNNLSEAESINLTGRHYSHIGFQIPIGIFEQFKIVKTEAVN